VSIGIFTTMPERRTALPYHPVWGHPENCMKLLTADQP